ncbi:putative RNA-directed DNA polymerase, eukaryota, reverse transcriptase zinc-binding domain protein [Tanacetum coccineum]
MHHNNGAFVLFGDFNEVRFNYERLGSTFYQTQADNFNNYIINNDLIELPMGSRLFTWMNKAGTKLSKLDCFLLSDNVIEALPDAQVTALDKFFNSWFNRDGFDDFISSEWNSFGQLLSHEKLKGLKAKIKVLLRDTKANERRHKEEVLVALKNLDIKIDSNSATDEDQESRIKFLHEIDKLDRIHSLDMQQKSRIMWDIEGDENSKFFMALSIKDVELIPFMEKFELHDSTIDIHSMSYPSVLNLNDHTSLEKDVTMEEIKVVVWNCGSLIRKKMPPGSNSSFITLIPKVSNPIHVKDYCPISLINTHYKIIAKILANRLAKVVDKIISQEQYAFIVGRQILDGPLMLSEVIDCFGLTWRDWINACLVYSRTSILVNGSPTSEFSVKRGLRQGDPLSHLLFIIVMEGLHMSLQEACYSGLIHGIKIGSSNITLSHMYYANDVVITTD